MWFFGYANCNLLCSFLFVNFSISGLKSFKENTTKEFSGEPWVFMFSPIAFDYLSWENNKFGKLWMIKCSVDVAAVSTSQNIKNASVCLNSCRSGYI